MDTESGRESAANSISSSKNQTATPKRSFDVAFLTGVSETQSEDQQISSDEEEEEDLRSAAKKSIDEKAINHKLLHQPTAAGSPKSAFKKVSKINHNNNNSSSSSTAESSGSSSNLPVDLSMMTSASPSSYYHPFSFPAIATTLSLQLLQQNTAAKGLAMSLFSHPAAAAAAAAMAAHQQSFFQQQQQQHPPIKSAAGVLQSPRPTGRPDGANNLIEDYLRVQASLYQQQQSEKDFNLFASAAAANKTIRQQQQQADSGGAAYCPSFHSALDHRLSARPNSSSMAPPPPPPAAPTPSIVVPPQQQQPQSQTAVPPLQLPAAALAASLASAPSQNVCAKCNLSFRMTSDLVYHMRSQHRRDANTDPVRQKRQEKLRCPVCGENFRERHHLTRHMTSHEDRELEAK